MSNKDEVKKEGLRSIKEFDISWTEYFKDKPKPKNDEEDKKQHEEFYHWYNYVRKQSDTEKTPAEMYKNIYGKEPPQNFPISSQESTSRMMNLGWDEDYDEDDTDKDKEDELDDAEEEGVSIAENIFDDIWKNIKQETEGQSKKESCKYSFILGFLNYMRMMDMKADIIEKNMKNMSKEDIQKMIEGFKEYGGKNKDEQ